MVLFSEVYLEFLQKTWGGIISTLWKRAGGFYPCCKKHGGIISTYTKMTRGDSFQGGFCPYTSTGIYPWHNWAVPAVHVTGTSPWRTLITPGCTVMNRGCTVCAPWWNGNELGYISHRPGLHRGDVGTVRMYVSTKNVPVHYGIPAVPNRGVSRPYPHRENGD